MVPSAGNRRALLERGDADISYDLPNKDFVELKGLGKLNIISTPYSNGIQYIGMNVTKPPFDNLKVRQAVAYAIPYQKIMDAVLFGLSKPMFGAPAGAPTEVAWPQPHKYNTDIAKAKQLMAEAGYPNGFETTLSFDLGFAGVNEPLCVLTQESLAQIGIKCTINKIPGATWRTELNKKVLPLYTNVFSGWLDYPEYFFIWCYHGKNSIFNTMSYQSKELDGYIDGAVTAAAEGNKAGYDKDVKSLRRSRLHRHSAHSAVPALRQRRDAEERVRLSVLVPPPARLSRAGEGVIGFTELVMPGRTRWASTSFFTHRKQDVDGRAAATTRLRRGPAMTTQNDRKPRWKARHAADDPQAHADRGAEPDRRRDRHLPADARAARRSGGLFRRSRRHQGGDRADQGEARTRQAALRAVRALRRATSRAATSAIRSPPASRSARRSRTGCRPRPNSRCSA